MRILMVNLTNFDKIEGGSTHQFSLFRHWKQQGFDVKMIAPNRKSVSSYPPSRIKGIEFSPSLRFAKLPPAFDALAQVPLIIYHRIHWKADVLYIRFNLLTFLLVVIARIFGMKVVVEHNGWGASERRLKNDRKPIVWFEDKAQIWAAKWAHISRCVTTGIARRLQENGIDEHKIFTVGNGTDIHKFYPKPRAQSLEKLGLEDSPYWIGFIGGLAPWQGLETAINALPYIRNKFDVRLIIAGDGPMRERLKQQVNTLGLENCVIFLGHVAYDQANTVINAFDVAIAPFTKKRNSEIGLSALKIRDYAAAGRMVLASDIEGIRELKSNDWLHLHTPDDSYDLSQKLIGILKQTDFRENALKHARKIAEEQFSWGLIAARVAQKISSI